jgi:hypothetical protein
MSNNRIILVIKASDVDVSSLPEDKRNVKNRAFKDAVYDHLLKNYGVSRENIIVHIQNDIITIEWSPQEKNEYIEPEFQRSMSLLTDGKLEEARFILEDMAFRLPDDPNMLYYLVACPCMQQWLIFPSGFEHMSHMLKEEGEENPAQILQIVLTSWKSIVDKSETPWALCEECYESIQIYIKQ